jgi:hypothetical protein
MAIGDIIIGLTSATSTETNYQPSSGVELVVTSVTGIDEMRYGQYDGTNFSGTRGVTGNFSGYGTMSNMKIGITNTYYFRFKSDTGRAYFSAIQTK